MKFIKYKFNMCDRAMIVLITTYNLYTNQILFYFFNVVIYEINSATYFYLTIAKKIACKGIIF